MCIRDRNFSNGDSVKHCLCHKNDKEFARQTINFRWFKAPSLQEQCDNVSISSTFQTDFIGIITTVYLYLQGFLTVSGRIFYSCDAFYYGAPGIVITISVLLPKVFIKGR